MSNASKNVSHTDGPWSADERETQQGIALDQLAQEINESLRPADSPTPGAVWMFKGERVTITYGAFLIGGRISNYFYFRYADGRAGVAYDNDRATFHPANP